MNLKTLWAALGQGPRSRARDWYDADFEARIHQIRAEESSIGLLKELHIAWEEWGDHPLEVLPFSAMRIFGDRGSRLEYERLYFHRRQRLVVTALLAVLYPERPEYLTAVEDVLWAVMDDFSWVLPAHFDWSGVPLSPADPGSDDSSRPSMRHHLDLFSCETAATLAEVGSLLEDRLAQATVDRLRHQVIERVLEPFVALGSLYSWETSHHNWAAVCAGSIGLAALLVLDDIRALAPLLTRCVAALNCFLEGYGADGVCTEGLAYWTYGFGYFAAFADALRLRTAGAIDLMASEKVRAIARFPQACLLPGGKIVNFSDCSPRVRLAGGLMDHLATLDPQIRRPESSLIMGLHDDHCYRFQVVVRNLFWARNAIRRPIPPADETRWFEQAQWWISRKAFGSVAVVAAIKGGHNAENHNHNDVGHLMVHVGTETLLVDLGAGEYTKEYFGSRRYQDFLCTGSQGHSVPIVNGQFQIEGSLAAASQVRVDAGPSSPFFQADLSASYAAEAGLASLVRRLDWDEIDRVPVLHLVDRWSWRQEPGTITERLVTLVEPQVRQTGRVRLSGGTSALELVWNAALAEVQITKTAFQDHFGQPVPVFLVDFHLAPGQEEFILDLVPVPTLP